MIPDFVVGPSILMYHSIADCSDDPYAVPAGKFQDQISWLLDHEFEPVPLSTIVDLLKRGDYHSLKKKVVFTFDDGYRDFVTAALPTLLNHKAPATVFIVAGMLGEKASWSGNSKHVQLMAEDEIRHIRSQSISLGSHTMTHTDLTTLHQEELNLQLTESCARLKDLGESFYALAYPWGQWSSQILDAVKASGYECAVTVGGEMRQDRIDLYHLPRLTMRADIDLKSFQALFDWTIVKRVRKVGSILKKFFSQ